MIGVMKALCALAFLLIAACSAEDMAEMEADKLGGMNLSPAERAIAEALVEGFKKETGAQMLRSRDVGRAACYAKSVKMPSQFARVHALYLKDYSAVDGDYYGWFRRQGVSDEAAYKFFGHVEEGFNACSIGALAKKRLGG